MSLAADFFNHPSVKESKFNFSGNWVNPCGTFRNGNFQHIIWLGVNGYLIINHFAPREIILVDPWPSYRRFNAGRGGRSPFKRLFYLVDWLRKKSGEGYTIKGIIVSHRHFDHANDVPAVLEMLCAPQNKKYQIKNANKETIFTSPSIAIDDLPIVFADNNSITHIKKKNDYKSDILKFSEIVTTDNKSVDYKSIGIDGCPPCGTALKSFNAGGFGIEPYVWDHMNLTTSEYNILELPGSRQKLSAFNIKWLNADDAKKTFIIGSAGEMASGFTTHPIVSPPPLIRTDTLVTSITIPVAPKYFEQIKDAVNFQTLNIKVSDYIVPTHYEDYFLGPPKPLSKSKGFYKNHSRVDQYIKELEKLDPVAAKKVISLKRLRFEYMGIPGPLSMKW
ncbi:MAG: MBL fold metallo-hydrolase [Deltaproteobacteria bacterium]|nr:MBL fold metallo-hydrolase [Deltaproteobacteria bacterium]